MSSFIYQDISYNIISSTLPLTAEIGNNQSYTGITNIIIPNKVLDEGLNEYIVVGISQLAFSSNLVIKSFDISECTSLTYIDRLAFLGTPLNNFIFSSSLINLDNAVFADCSSITSLDFSICINLTLLNDGNFRNLTQLHTCILPPNLTEIRNGVFISCNSLPNIIIPATVSSIGDYAFYNCPNLISVTFSGITIPSLINTSFINIGNNSTAYYQYGTSNADLTRLRSYNFFTNYVEVNTPIPEPIICFKEGSKILTVNGYKSIEDLKKGDLIKTLRNDFKPITIIGKRNIYHIASKERIKNQLYQCSIDEYPELLEPLIITGCHSILVENSKEVVNENLIKKVIEINGNIYLTDDKLRLPACVDKRTTVYEIPGNYSIYHLALEHNDVLMNYGIYANGLLVETCSERNLKELSGMELL